jgi:hypothetical protein
MELGYLVLGWGRVSGRGGVSGEEGVEGGGVETDGEVIKEMVERDFLGRTWFEQETGRVENRWVRMMHLESKITTERVANGKTSNRSDETQLKKQ